MKKQLLIISIFTVFNLAIGRLFQESLSVVCFSELSIVAISGFFYWNSIAHTIQKGALKWNVIGQPSNFLYHSGIGLSAAMVNILIGQGLILLSMKTIYHCTSPSFDLVNASLTNNIAVNLMCYFSILFFFVHNKKERDVEQDSETASKEKFEHIDVTKKGVRFLLTPSRITYVETSNNCIVLHTDDGKFVKYQSLKSLQEKLPQENFKRVHRSFLVNVDAIECIEKNKNGDGIIRLKNGEVIKFSRTYLHNIA